MLYKVMGAAGQERLIKTITTHMQTVPPPIRERAVALFKKVDATFGQRMKANLLSGDYNKPDAARPLVGAAGD